MSEVLDRMINEGYNKGISEGEARAKKAYEEELAEMKAELEKYKAMVMKA